MTLQTVAHPSLPADSSNRDATFADADHHVSPVDVAHQDGHHQDKRRVPRMHPRQAVQNTLAMLITELIFGDQGDKQKPHQERHHEEPHQRITVIAAPDTTLDDVARSQPSQHHDDARPHGAEVFSERRRQRYFAEFLLRHMPPRVISMPSGKS